MKTLIGKTVESRKNAELFVVLEIAMNPDNTWCALLTSYRGDGRLISCYNFPEVYKLTNSTLGKMQAWA